MDIDCNCGSECCCCCCDGIDKGKRDLTSIITIFLFFCIICYILLLSLSQNDVSFINVTTNISRDFYFSLDEKCYQEFDKFQNDLIDNEKYYDKVILVAKILSGIIVISSIVLFIYMITVCGCDVNFKLLTFIVPCFAILCNIIMIVMAKIGEINFECLNESSNKTSSLSLDYEYQCTNTIIYVIGGLTFFFNFINIILLLIYNCKYKNHKNKKNAHTTTEISVSNMNKNKIKNNSYGTVKKEPSEYRIPFGGIAPHA
jgi:hypothetical protein